MNCNMDHFSEFLKVIAGTTNAHTGPKKKESVVYVSVVVFEMPLSNSYVFVHKLYSVAINYKKQQNDNNTKWNVEKRDSKHRTFILNIRYRQKVYSKRTHIGLDPFPSHGLAMSELRGRKKCIRLFKHKIHNDRTHIIVCSYVYLLFILLRFTSVLCSLSLVFFRFIPGTVAHFIHISLNITTL